jgi:glycosyltransferase involved in cell wall biosynthesis
MTLGLLARRPIVVEHHGFQTICPNGQLLIEPQGTPCPGHFMASRYQECLRCNSAGGWLVSFKLWLLTFLRRFLCARVSANITPTDWLGQLLELPRVTAIPHGLDARSATSRVVPPSGTPVIAFMGRLVTTKGVHLLLKAATILKEQNRPFELLIIGEGPERAGLEQFVRDSQITDRVRFAGRLDGSQLEATLAHAAVVVVPSLGGEVFGMVVAENMARGLPVVASDLGAFVEVLGKAGLTFRTGDESHLASVLTGLLDDPSAGDRLGQLAHERAFDLFSTGRMIEGHVRAYRAVRDAIKD